MIYFMFLLARYVYQIFSSSSLKKEMNMKLKNHAFKETWVGMLAQYPQKPILWQLNDQVCTRQIGSSEVLFTDTCFDL